MKPGCWKTICALSVLCVATPVASRAQVVTTLFRFDGTNGSNPEAGLLQGGDGGVYGTNVYGGANDDGTVFKITQAGTLLTLHSFDFANGEGPLSGVRLATNGDFYGTTWMGGAYGGGTAFKMTAGGILTKLHDFGSGTDGIIPNAGLIQATNGYLYGTASEGGTHHKGTVFGMTTEGVLTTLHNFCFEARCSDGGVPYAGLVQATNGNLYGTTFDGGTNGYGTVFTITMDGSFTLLHSFNLTDGANPYGTLIQAADGILYGTTVGGGTSGQGTVFKITLDGAVTTLHSFDVADGSNPYGALVLATDGNFYGTAETGGANTTCNLGCGTLFQITPQGTLTTLYNFCSQAGCSDGAEPVGGLVQDTNGVFYGTTFAGGNSGCHATFPGCGTVFRLNVGLGPFVTFVRFAGKVAQTGPILGQGLTGATSVSLNGVPANFTVISDTLIQATIPVAATTGYVTVTTPSGTLKSNVPLHVIP